MIFFMFIDQEGLSQKTPRKLFYDAPLLTLYLFRAAHLRVILCDPGRVPHWGVICVQTTIRYKKNQGERGTPGGGSGYPVGGNLCEKVIDSI